MLAGMAISLDLNTVYLTRRHGDMQAVYTWVNGERALVLIPRLRARAPWYVVMDSAAYRYDDPAYLARQCVRACEVLGIEPSRANWVRIATIIHEGLPDLLRMPAAPSDSDSGVSAGCVRVRAGAQTVAEHDIVLPRAAGASYG